MTNANPVKVAMIGVGKSSGIYLKNITTVFKEVELIGVCDLIPDARKKAQIGEGIHRSRRKSPRAENL